MEEIRKNKDTKELWKFMKGNREKKTGNKNRNEHKRGEYRG